MGSQDQYTKLKKYMTDGWLTYTDEWLTACYNWICESHSQQTLTDKFVQQQISIQWLDANLEDMESSCLQPNLKAERKVVLSSSYALQVNWFKDIGESAYSQYNKIKKLENDNTNVQATDGAQPMAGWQPKPRRCFYLSLTDGSQTIHGMEMEIIPALSNMKPGCKILVIGPVDCRRGVLHLKPKNVKFLGGDVEDLVARNSVENILSKALNDPNPKETFSQTTQSSQSQPSQSRPARKLSSKLKEIAKKRKNEDTLASQRTRNPVATGSLTQTTITTFLSTNPTQSTQGLPNNSSIRSTPATQPLRSFTSIASGLTTQPLPTFDNDGFNSSDDELFLDDNLVMVASGAVPVPSARVPSTPPLPSLTPPPVTKPPVITLGDSPIAAPAPKIKTKPPLRKKVAAEPYQYIKQIKYGQFKIGDTVNVKAIVATLASDLQVDKASGEWKLNVNINDGSGYLIVGIAPSVLDKVIGFTPAQMKQLKATKSGKDKTRVNEGIQRMTTKLVHFSGIMRIKVCEEQKMVVELMDITNDHVLELVTRTSGFS